MRNFFVYARTRDNQFFSCAVQVSSFKGQDSEDLTQRLHDAAIAEFKRRGNPLPVHDVVRLRCIPDARCDLDASGYGPVLADPPRRYKRVKS